MNIKKPFKNKIREGNKYQTKELELKNNRKKEK